VRFIFYCQLHHHNHHHILIIPHPWSLFLFFLGTKKKGILLFHSMRVLPLGKKTTSNSCFFLSHTLSPDMGGAAPHDAHAAWLRGNVPPVLPH
jgi:hypothetical protein